MSRAYVLIDEVDHLPRWRRPEARLLAALSCVPHTPELYESLYLFLVPASMWQGALLAALNYGIVFARRAVPPPADYVGDMMATGQWMVLLLYLPCLVMVMLRPNVADDAALPAARADARMATG